MPDCASGPFLFGLRHSPQEVSENFTAQKRATHQPVEILL